MPIILYQNLYQFLHKPFGRIKPDTTKYDRLYDSLVLNKKIKLVEYAHEDEEYYYHLKIPSESLKGEAYDVVIQFFKTDKWKVKLNQKDDLTFWYVQFYSNSPGFVYKYANLYYTYGYLISSFYGKMEEEFKHVSPIITNPEFRMCFDKSIYLACRYLYDTRLSNLVLFRKNFIKKVTLTQMLANIRDFATVKMDREILSMEQNLKQEMIRDKANAIKQEAKDRRNEDSSEPKSPVSKLLSHFIKPNSKVKKIRASNHTSGTTGIKTIIKKKKKR
jgi:hypothetical protein